MSLAKKVPGGYVTLLVGGAVFIYIIGKQGISPAVTKFSDDTVGALQDALPGKFIGMLTALVTVGVFLNEHSFGKAT